MKKEYIRPAMCVVKLANSCPLLIVSGESSKYSKDYEELGDTPVPTYKDDDEDIIDEDDVI